MQGPGSRRGSISTTDELELHRLLKPENSLPSRPSTLFESSYAISVHESSISPGSQSYASFVGESILPWWEAEAEDILRGIDLQTIRLLCRYRLYKDSSIPASIPRTRWTPILNSFLLQLGVGTYSRSDIDNLDLDQKAKELLTRLEPSIPDDDGPWGCLPSSAAFFQLDASQVASKLNEESLSLFKNITFLNHVRKALYPGETIDPVEAFKGWHDDLFHLVLGRLKSFPAEEEKFVQIKQLLPEGSPVYWAVAQSLFSAQARHPNRIGIDPLNLELIYGSLRHIARNQHENLIGTLKRLAVLEVRFHRKYLREEEMDWTREFDTTTEFFDNITTMSPRELADSLTYSDIEEFRLLRPQNIINGDSYLQHLHRQWNRRCQAAQECLAVGTRPSTLLTALAKELRVRRNFYSLCAILQALRETGFDESELPLLFILIESDRNYASYRKEFRESKGLPFLLPHISQLKMYQQQAVSEMLSYGGYEHSISSARAQDLEQRETSMGREQLSWNAWAWAHITYHIPCLAARRNKEKIQEALRYA